MSNTTIGILLVFLFFIGSTEAQDHYAESVLMDCIYERYQHQGLSLKKSITDFEQLLVDENILGDKSGHSYLTVLNKIATEPNFEFNPSKRFMPEKLNAQKIDTASNKDCQIKLINSIEFGSARIDRFNYVIDSVVNLKDWGPPTLAMAILSVLEEKDLEQEYYKLKVFPLFNIVNFADLSNRIFPGLSESEDLKDKLDLSKALSIFLDNQNRIWINNKIVNLEELKYQVSDYEIRFKDESLIVIRTGDESIFKFYLEIRNAILNEIKSLREKLSLEKFNLELEKLDAQKTNEIFEIYPQKIVLQE